MTARPAVTATCQQDDVRGLLHALSQPLTSISLALGIVAYPISEMERKQWLLLAQKECSRAMDQLERLRAVTTAEDQPIAGHEGKGAKA